MTRPSPQDSTPMPPSGDAQSRRPLLPSIGEGNTTQLERSPRQVAGERSASHGEDSFVVSHVTEVVKGVHRLTNGVANFYVIEQAGKLVLVDAGAPKDWALFTRAARGDGDLRPGR